MFKTDCQKHFTKLLQMKNTQSEIKPIKSRKQPGTTSCFACKDYTQNFRPEKVKMSTRSKKTSKNLTVLFVDQINKDF